MLYPATGALSRDRLLGGFPGDWIDPVEKRRCDELSFVETRGGAE